MKKTIFAIGSAFALALPAVLADFGDMMGFGMMGGAGMGIYGLLWFAIGAFIFSVIFWATHNWLVKGKRR